MSKIIACYFECSDEEQIEAVMAIVEVCFTHPQQPINYIWDRPIEGDIQSVRKELADHYTNCVLFVNQRKVEDGPKG